jgi:hypothetical protein
MPRRLSPRAPGQRAVEAAPSLSCSPAAGHQPVQPEGHRRDPPATGHDARVATRRRRAAHAAQLREAGETVAQIAAVLRCSPWTVYSYLADPVNDRNRRLKDTYRGRCEQCRTPTSGGDGSQRPRPLCPSCRDATHRRWTRETVIAALRDWSSRSGAGRPPSSYELDRSVLLGRGDPRATLLADGQYPSPRTCRRLFGSYPNAAAATWIPQG